jgi:hypothetical protein
MRRDVITRAWFGLTALAVFAGLAVQVVVTASATEGRFAGVPARLGNLLCFFTIESNIIVGVTCLLLAIRLDRSSTAFQTWRLAGVLGIAVTGTVFHLVLSGLHTLTGAAKVADFVLHTLVPLLALAGWLVFGPRGVLTWRIAAWSLAYPVVWLVFTLIRGAIIDYYPYPFLEASRIGYGQVAVNCVLVTVLFLALAAAAVGLDRFLGRDPQEAAAQEAT